MGPDYEPAVASFLSVRVGPGDLCFDVGANVGVYALQFSHWSAPSGRVVAFEPNPEAVAVLLKHLRINGLSARVTVKPLAVGDQNGEATLYTADADGMGRLGEPNDQIADRSAASVVQVTTLDEFSRQSGLIPNWLIVDIEGYEFAALRGGSELIKSQRGKLGIVVEIHPSVWATSGTSRADAEALLRDFRLHAVPLTGQTDSLGEYGIVHLAFD
jgi:FkbM family methyltransferase